MPVIVPFIFLYVLSVVNLGYQVSNKRKIAKMSDSAFEKLKADVAALEMENTSLKAEAQASAAASAAKDAKILDLQTQLTTAQAAVGTSDADVQALDETVVAALTPPAASEPAVPPEEPAAS